ncbi:MAG: bifunctional serine/threonine-protein kinase/formylglycine-generating enzyme family protein [Planctomycetota bacterium]|nr:bifunctional serine/threonine-protein kinase/formylglycine-generating enzyme family protein [Planctomycetota bacterium]
MTNPPSPLSRTEFSSAVLRGRFGELAGKSLGPYRILDEISSGGMGVVFRAVHTQSLQEAALKLLLTEHNDPESLERFGREARVLEKIKHPNIVRLLGYGVQGDIPWLAMELVTGTSLRNFVVESRQLGQPTDYDWIQSTFGELAEALSVCHSHGVVHRDIKPANVVIAESDGRAVLVDFGLVKLDPTWLRQTHESLVLTRTLTKDGVGTPAFMAPEQLDPSGEFGPISARSDVWSFGATLFFALTGETPYGDLGQVNLFAALLMLDTRRLRSVESSCPPWLEEICTLCLTRKCLKRPGIKSIRAKIAAGPSGRRRAKWPWIVLALIGLFAAAILYLYANRSPELQSFHFHKSTKKLGQEWWSGNPLRFRADVGAGGGIAKFGGQTFTANDDGRFSGELKLEDGKHELELSVGETTKIFTVNIDSRAPVIELDAVKWGNYYVVDGQTLTGRVRDQSLVELTQLIDSVAMNEDHRFSISLPRSQRFYDLELSAVDRLGHVSHFKGIIATRHSLKWICARRLESHGNWNSTPWMLQDLIIDDVGRRLGKDYKWQRTNLYKNPGEKKPRFRIATFKHLKTGIELQLIPGGRFVMGTLDHKKELYVYTEETKHWTRAEFSDNLIQELPVHACKVSPLLVGRLETQQRHWDMMPEFPDKRSKQNPALPIDGVKWPIVKRWLKEAGGGLRLLSESEWEYAARAGTKTRFYWGDNIDQKYFWSMLNSHNKLQESRLMDNEDHWNAFGLVDMIGNVLEFCEDPMIGHYRDGPYDSKPRTTKENLLHARVVRGGGVGAGIIFTRASARDFKEELNFIPFCGFRVARSLPR